MAVPSSGAVSLAGIRAELATNTYDANATTQASLLECSDGTVSTINTGNNASDRPDGSTPHEMSEFYSYDHDLSTFADSKSFDFDGTNDYLHFQSGNIGTDIEATGSISVWVKLDSMSANGFIWQIKEEEGTDNQIILLWNNAAGVIRGNVKFGGTTNVVDSGSGLENDGNWHHVAMTWDSGSKTSANNIVRLYIDGSETDNDAIGNTWGSETGHAGFIIGRNDIQSNAYFNGHMNDIAFFNDVLTSSEVSAIYNSGSPKEEESHSGIIAYYTMEGYTDGDTTLVDDSGNSKTLQINNSTNIDSTDTP
tara:strand:+ start:212 stop:1135 length:924 start_codon:yes stop_codon:yes gene_type:complete